MNTFTKSLVILLAVLWCSVAGHDLQHNAAETPSSIIGFHKHNHNHKHIKRKDPPALEPRGKSGHVCAGNISWAPPQIISGVMGDGQLYADMDGDGLDDIVYITDDGHISVWLNGQPISPSNDGKPTVTGVNATREQYRLADIDGNGKADLVILDLKTGSLSAWLNGGTRRNSSTWIWNPVGMISPSVGDAAGVRFADVLGHGRSDLVYFDPISRMTIYRNDYNPVTRKFHFTKITSSPIDFGGKNRSYIQFADLTGNHRADILWVYPTYGTTMAWINKNPTRLDGWFRSDSAIDPHHNSTLGDQITLARIYVPYGRADYVVINPWVTVTLGWRNLCNKYAPGSSSSADQAVNGTNQSVSNSKPVSSVIVSSTIVTVRRLQGHAILSRRDETSLSTITIKPSTTSIGLLSNSTAPSIITITTLTLDDQRHPKKPPNQKPQPNPAEQPKGGPPQPPDPPDIPGQVNPLNPPTPPISPQPPINGIIPAIGVGVGVGVSPFPGLLGGGGGGGSPPAAPQLPDVPSLPAPPGPPANLPPPAPPNPNPANPNPAKPEPEKPPPEEQPEPEDQQTKSQPSSQSTRSTSRSSSSHSSSRSSTSSSSSSSSCSKSAVTNYYVLCISASGSKSCRTASTSVTSACSSTGTTITTTSVRQCSPVSISPDDSQGEDGDPSSSRTLKTSSCSASTVTNVLVSCGTAKSGSATCTAVSRSVATGCSTTGRTTTTSTASPSVCKSVSIDPNEDQGSCGYPSNATTSNKCSTSMATKFFVSCTASGTSGCKTVSSSVTRGCVNATTSTASSTCPRITLDPNEDQGSNSGNESSRTSICSSSMVTNFYVSCSASGTSGCKTISTSITRGCNLTATTSTTTSAKYCGTQSIDPFDDQGEDGNGTVSISPSKSTSGSSISGPKATTTSKTSKTGSSTTSSTVKSTTTSKPSSSFKESTSKSTSAPPKPTPSAGVSKPPLPSTTVRPPPPATTAVNSSQYVIGYMGHLGYWEHSDSYSMYEVFYPDLRKLNKTFACTKSPLAWAGWQYHKYPKSYQPDYPAQIGPFANPEVGLKNCQYERTKDGTAGTLICDDNAGMRQSGTCRRVDSPLIPCKIKDVNYDWKSQVVCHVGANPSLAQCFDGSLPKGYKFKDGTTMVLVDHDNMNDWIRKMCLYMANEKNDMNDPYKVDKETIHRKLRSSKSDQPVEFKKWDRSLCADNFAAVLDNCPDYGGAMNINGVKFELYSYNEH